MAYFQNYYTKMMGPDGHAKSTKVWRISLKLNSLEFFEICQFAMGHPVTSFSSKLATTIISQKRWIAEPSGNGVTNEICTTT